MKSLRKICVWLYMLTKKLFHRWSFLVLLAIIPAIIPAINGALSEDGSIVKIALYAESDSDETSNAVIENLTTEKSIISYTVYSSKEAAIDAVKRNKCDAAWIFDADFTARMNNFADKKSIRPFVEIVEQEDSVALMLAREKLFGALYSKVSYRVFSNFIKTELLPDANISDEVIWEYFEAEKQNDNLIEIKMTGSDEALNLEDSNFLKMPMRGLLSLLIMLCGFAAAGFFMKERRDGIYDWLSPRAKIVPAFGSCFSAVLVSSVVVFASIYAGGFNLSLKTELCSMLVYIFAATSFCVLLTAIFKSFSKFGPVIPFLMIIMLVLCPIFFTIDAMPGIRHMIAPYYYLLSLYNPEYVWYMAIYAVVMLALSFGLYSLRARADR